MSGPAEDNTVDSPVPPDGAIRSWSSRLFLTLLGGVSILYAAVLIYHVSVPPESENNIAFLERCRQICLQYGLVSTGNVKQDARAYLTAVDSQPMSAALSEILADSSFEPHPSENHPMVGQIAPPFQLSDELGQTHDLQAFTQDGPVVVVFYNGFTCSHCVAQLFALNDDARYFEELGVRIVAISSDTPKETTDAFSRYGRFSFTVLSDRNATVAAQFGCFEEETTSSEGVRKHGTFLLDQAGKVVWANTGFQPFVDNRSLLVHLARITGHAPTTVASNL